MKFSIAINLLFAIAEVNANIRLGHGLSKDAVVDGVIIEEGQKACTSGFVICENGLWNGGPTTCQEQCNRKCCQGDTNGNDPCANFTGSLCFDGKTCRGDDACLDARIDIVAQSCKGARACWKANLPGKRMKGSCVSDDACCESDESTFEDNASEDGTLIFEQNGLNFVQSCNGKGACMKSTFAADTVDGCCDVDGSCTGQTVDNSCSASSPGDADDADDADEAEADLVGPDVDSDVKTE